MWAFKVMILWKISHKLNALVKYLPQYSQFNSWINFMNILYENFQIASSSKILATLITIKFALICNFSPVFCVKFLSQWSQLNSTICINTFKLHPIVKFLPHWSQLNLFFHEQQYYVPSIQYCVWNICHTHHICNFLNPLWTFSICTFSFQWSLFYFYIWIPKSLIFSISWIFCLCTFKLNALAKYFHEYFVYVISNYILCQFLFSFFHKQL